MSTKHKPDRPWMQILLGGVITADHICRQYPSDPSIREPCKNLLRLMALDEPDPAVITPAVCQWVKWWMATQFVKHLDEHVLHLIELQAAEEEYGLSVMIENPEPGSISTDVCTDHMALMCAPYNEPGCPPPMPDRLATRQIAHGHVLVLFTVPGLCVQVGLIAETEGLQQ